MSTDSNVRDLPPVDDAVAALMASPEFQAQMAALTQQAMASLQALVAALALVEAQQQLSVIDMPAPPVDEALVALMASPEYQAQMAALTQQAAASVRALATNLGALGGQSAIGAPKVVEPIIDIPYGLAVEPKFLPWSAVPETYWGAVATGFVGPAVMPLPVDAMPVDPMPVDPMPAAFATDMLAMLPRAAAAIEVAPSVPAVSSAADDVPMPPVFLFDQRSGGEGGIG